MRVLFVSSEIFPLAKTGGLADVSAALPAALASLGVDMRLLMPGYPKAIESATDKSVQVEIRDFMSAGILRLIAARTPDVGRPIWLVDCPSLFQRLGGLYQDEHGKDWPDNAKRFAVFNHIAALISRGALVPGWRADIVHANDWHAGLLPLLIATAPGEKPGTVFTMHNVAYQGLFPADFFPQLGLPEHTFASEGMEFYGKVSFLKAGIRYSDQLTTVSPTYAREIMTPEFGFGLEGLLQSRRQDLTGILNGVDYAVWNPLTDPQLPANYDVSAIAGKQTCKAALQIELGLPAAAIALLVYVSRLNDQKMADVLLKALPAILERDIQFALLGEGDRWLEDGFREAGRRYPGRVATHIGYEEPLAHRFQAGADILLHPARFEPCGLTQLYAMRYGTLPIARRVGGLADTIVGADNETIHRRTATGFAFENATAADMIACLDRSLELRGQPIAWRGIQRRAMQRDFGWGRPARQYLKLYRQLAPHAVIDLRECDPAEKRDVRVMAG